jgi:two-component system response regulator DesR
LVAHYALVRGALAALLNRERDIQIVGQAADPGQAVGTAQGCRPDVVVIDPAGPPHPFDVAALGGRLTGCGLLVLADDTRLPPTPLPAIGFLSDDAPPSSLAQAVRRLAAPGRGTPPTTSGGLRQPRITASG